MSKYFESGIDERMDMPFWEALQTMARQTTYLKGVPTDVFKVNFKDCRFTIIVETEVDDFE